MSNEIIVHSWEWKRPTKYVEKYQDKKGNWVYVYDNGIKNKGSRPYRLGERIQNEKPAHTNSFAVNTVSNALWNYADKKKKKDDKKYVDSHYFDTQNKDDTYHERKSVGKSKIYVDKRDNTSSAKKLEEDIPNADPSFINSVLNKIGIDTSPEFIDLETGRKMSRAKVNAYAALNTIRTSAAKAYGKAYVSTLSFYVNRKIPKNIVSYEGLENFFKGKASYTYDDYKLDSEEVKKYRSYFDNFGKNGYSFDRIINKIYKEIHSDTINSISISKEEGRLNIANKFDKKDSNRS